MRLFIIAVVSICVSSSGFFAAHSLKKKQKTLEYMSELLKYMSWKIENYRTALEDIYLSFDCPFFDKTGFSEALGNCGFVKALDKLPLDSDIKERLVSFGENLGLKNASFQTLSCIETAKKVDEKLERMMSEYGDKRKVYIALSLSFGAIIFIICI